MEKSLYFVDVLFSESNLPKYTLYHLGEECLMNSFEEDVTGKGARFFFTNQQHANAFSKFYKNSTTPSQS